MLDLRRDKSENLQKLSLRSANILRLARLAADADCCEWWRCCAEVVDKLQPHTLETSVDLTANDRLWPHQCHVCSYGRPQKKISREHGTKYVDHCSSL